MEYTKQLLTLDQQISILKQRGLIIENEAEAESILDTISYFRLAGYWRLMEADKQNHVFKPGSYFSQIISLYHFDEELRMLVFAAIQQIEVTVRTRLIRLFSERHGAFWFMDATLADSNTMYQSNLNKLQEELNRSEDEFIYIAYWLNSINPANTFIKDIKALLVKYPVADPAAMGFPRGWKNEPLWL